MSQLSRRKSRNQGRQSGARGRSGVASTLRLIIHAWKLIYLDMCCFNRPYDDQSQARIRLETEAKLLIQEHIHAGRCKLAWSAVLDFECR
ncbi:MAG: hypothetical protein MZV65_05220 [Chromatiales bacterium]|nr:hypothetical protein [Chromatiales bacterium]